MKDDGGSVWGQTEEAEGYEGNAIIYHQFVCTQAFCTLILSYMEVVTHRKAPLFPPSSGILKCPGI